MLLSLSYGCVSLSISCFSLCPVGAFLCPVGVFLFPQGAFLSVLCVLFFVHAVGFVSLSSGAFVTDMPHIHISLSLWKDESLSVCLCLSVSTSLGLSPSPPPRLSPTLAPLPSAYIDCLFPSLKPQTLQVGTCPPLVVCLLKPM